MPNLKRAALGLVALACAATPVAAQTPTTPTTAPTPTTPTTPTTPAMPSAPAVPAAPSMPTPPSMPSAPTAPTPASASAAAVPSAGALGATATATPPAGPKTPREHKFGDFDAGGRVRLPNGPDEQGKFATFNWIAVDGHGAFYLAKTVTIDATLPIALKHPGTLMSGATPDTFGGFMFTLDAMLPKINFPGLKKDRIGLLLSGGWMRQGALLLSDKDYPMFDGPLEPGVTVGPVLQVKLSSLLDFSTTPLFVYQSGGGGMAAQRAVQVPVSLIVKLGSLLKVSADLGVFTGPGYSLSADKGGRIAAGGALDIKIGPIQAHAGAGVASLLTGGAYPTIGDSVYIDLNAKYVK